MTISKKECHLYLPVLRLGDRGSSVRALQLLLIGKGYSCGYRADDGVFGKRTENALRRFQDDRYLEVTGIADAESWYALLIRNDSWEGKEWNL